MRKTIMAALLAALLPFGAQAQKTGGILRVEHRDSPGSLSIHEEGTVSAVMPAMGLFNNLVEYDQHIARNSMDTIVPDLATAWTWNAEYTELTFTLRQGVRWHDGKPFTSDDVKCTFDLLTNKAREKFRVNNRSGWYFNLQSVSQSGPYEVTLHLKRSQPALLALLASGFSPMYPCHVSPHDMRVAPIGTGPFRFRSFKPNESITVVRNPDYWKPGRPYLDGIEYTIIPNRSTAMLSFVAGRFDMTFPYEVTPPLMGDIKAQMPQANCIMTSTNVAANVLMDMKPPFDNPDLRRAVVLALDRQAFIDVITEGKGATGGAMMPPPDGAWGLPPDQLHDLPGFDPDVAKRRDAARGIMQGLGYGPDKHLPVKVSTRNIPGYRDAAIMLIGQLKEIWIDGELDPIETAIWQPKLIRREYQMALSLVGNGVDDPDQQFYESYVCGSRTYMGYCNKALDALVDRQSMEPDRAKRQALVWQIDAMLQRDAVRPMLYFLKGGTCMRPEVKGITIMVNSIYNGWRMEDAWLDR
jgi:peptide/nickel transport system substrate-binding protein